MMRVHLIIFLGILSVVSSGCVKDSPAPACSESPLDIFVTGGCFSRSAIIDERIDPEIPCLGLSTNNCNSPELSLVNECENTVSFGNETIPFESCLSMDCKKVNKRSLASFSEESSEGFDPFSRYSLIVGKIPDENRTYSLDGMIEGTNFTVTFTLTRRLC